VTDVQRTITARRVYDLCLAFKQPLNPLQRRNNILASQIRAPSTTDRPGLGIRSNDRDLADLCSVEGQDVTRVLQEDDRVGCELTVEGAVRGGFAVDFFLGVCRDQFGVRTCSSLDGLRGSSVIAIEMSWALGDLPARRREPAHQCPTFQSCRHPLHAGVVHLASASGTASPNRVPL
jgi:hypothetical protein